MKLFLLSLCIFSSYAHSIALDESKNLDYRLNTDIEPLHYELDLTPYFDNSVPGKTEFTFDGITSITLKATKTDIDTITLHKVDLNITTESLVKKSNIFASLGQTVDSINIKSHEYDAQTQKYTLKLATALVKDELYVLSFKYVGSLVNTNNHGFYYTKYKDGDVSK